MKITEIFTNTWQGEGLLLGVPATFIRTAGCVEPYCSWCDSKHSWGKGKEMSVRKIVDRVKKYKPELIVITGGEPYLQEELRELITELLSLGLQVQIETSGKLPVFKMKGMTIVMSPKWYDGEYRIARSSDLQKADQLKFVVGNWNDFSHMLHFISKYGIDKKKVCIMPEGVTQKEQLKKMKELLKHSVEHNIRISPRLHVLLWGNRRRV